MNTYNRINRIGLIDMIYNNIIISGLPGSGKSTLCKELSDIFHWPVFSIGDEWRKRWMQIPEDTRPSFEKYWRERSVQENKDMDARARAIFEKGDVIGGIRYAINYKDLNSLLIFVTASLDIRAKRLGFCSNHSLSEIKETLIKRERDEIEMGQRLYFDMVSGWYDYRDSNYYNLVLNSGKMRLDEEVEQVKTAMKYPCKQ